MASTAVELVIALIAKDAASATLSKVGGEVDKLGRAGQALKVGMGIAAAGLGIGIAALVDFGKAAAEEQVGIERLHQALGNLGEGYLDATDTIETTIAAMERTTAFSDGEMRDALSMLISITGDYDEAMKRLPIATDFARGANIDLATASKLLGKVTDENVGVLKRYGIAVEKGADSTELLGKVQAKFGGQSAAFAKTATGQWQIFQNQIENLKEDLGSALLPIATKVFGALIGFIDAIRNNPGLKNFAAAIGTVVEILGEMFSVITGTAPDAGAKLTDAVGPARAKEIMGALAAVREIIKAVIDAVGEMVEWFRGSSAEASALRGTLEALGAVLSWIGEHVIPGAIGEVRWLIDTIKTLWGWVSAVKDALGNMLGFASNIVGQVQGLLGGIDIPWFQQGGVMPFTGLAMLHAGERVIPAGQNGTASGGDQTIITKVYLNGREIATAVGDQYTVQRRVAGLS